jgi:hypothetical protein
VSGKTNRARARLASLAGISGSFFQLVGMASVQYTGMNAL